MSKLISYSLWGQSIKYLQGSIRNCEIASSLYPDFKLRFYCANDVPSSVIFKLEDLGAEIVEMNCDGSNLGMFWRFNAINDADLVLIRDCDSRPTLREKQCVEEFIKSDKTIHSIFDHPAHVPSLYLLMPGLTAFKQTGINYRLLIEQFDKKDKYGTDYDFFRSIDYLIKDDILIHDSFYGKGQKISIPRRGLEFIGKVFDENEETVSEHEVALAIALRKLANNA